MSAPEPPLTLKEVRRLADTTWVSSFGLYNQDRSVALSTRPCETVRRLCATVEQYAEDAGRWRTLLEESEKVLQNDAEFRARVEKARREAAEAEEELRLLREFEAACSDLEMQTLQTAPPVRLATLASRDRAWQALVAFRARQKGASS